MLKGFALLLLAFLCQAGFAQNVGINSTGTAPKTSAGLDVDFPDKGLLIPRVALASLSDITTIASPETSLLVYNTATAGTDPNNVTPGYYYFTGTAWTRLANGNTSVSGWGDKGNLGTDTVANFLGTIDSMGLALRTNNEERIHITPEGNVGIGTKRFEEVDAEKLLVSVGTEGTINAISARGRNSSYVQINVKNYSDGEDASSDLVATNDTGNEDEGYINMGINSSKNSDDGSTLKGPSKAYIFSTGSDFVIGNGTPDKNLTLYSSTTIPKTGGGIDTITTEKLRLNSTGVTFSQSLRVATTTTNLNIDDYTLICKNSLPMTVNLPDAAEFIGRVFYIKNFSNMQSITVKPKAATGQLIDGLSTATISKQKGGLMIQSDGENWYSIISDLL